MRHDETRVKVRLIVLDITFRSIFQEMRRDRPKEQAGFEGVNDPHKNRTCRKSIRDDETYIES